MPKRPLILRDYQAELSKLLISSIGKHSVHAPKARDMGGTTTMLAVIYWIWQHFDEFVALLGSSKQEYVDKAGEPKCLFWKLDYFWKNLPWWMRPPLRPKIDRKENAMINPINGSAITGESTNPNFGRGSRPAVIMLDEFANVECGYDVLSATGEATETRWFVSTFEGAYGAFYKIYQQMMENEPEHVFSMHWSKHPTKRRGLYTSETVNGRKRIKILDTDFKFPEKYKFVLDVDGKLRSPYYDDYCLKKAGSPQEVAQQLDMEPQAAGYQFMSTQVCEAICMKHSRRPVHRGEFVFTDPNGKVEWRERGDGPVQLWVHLQHDLTYKSEHDCGAGADISMGVGNKSGSNSAGAFYDGFTKEKIAQIITPDMPPHVFARYMAAAGRFFTGPNGPALLNWEDNGPGVSFRYELLHEIKYPRVWYRGDDRKPNSPKGTVPGWQTSGKNKDGLLNNYKAGLLEDRIFNRCAAAVMECAEYVHTENGIEYSKSMQTIDQNAAGERHGDMVIADALAYLAISDLPSMVAEEEPEIPQDSIYGRQRERQEMRRRAKGSW